MTRPTPAAQSMALHSEGGAGDWSWHRCRVPAHQHVHHFQIKARGHLLLHPPVAKRCSANAAKNEALSTMSCR